MVLIWESEALGPDLNSRIQVEDNSARLTVYRLPSYSPDYNPIEKLWKKVKDKGTHLHYFPTFEDLKNKVEETLLLFKNAPKEVLSLFVSLKEVTNSGQ